MSRGWDVVMGLALVVLGVWLITIGAVFLTAWGMPPGGPQGLHLLGSAGLRYYCILLAALDMGVALAFAWEGGGATRATGTAPTGLRPLSVLLLLITGVWFLFVGAWLVNQGGPFDEYTPRPNPTMSLVLASLVTLPLVNVWLGLLMTWDWGDRRGG